MSDRTKWSSKPIDNVKTSNNTTFGRKYIYDASSRTKWGSSSASKTRNDTKEYSEGWLKAYDDAYNEAIRKQMEKSRRVSVRKLSPEIRGMKTKDLEKLVYSSKSIDEMPDIARKVRGYSESSADERALRRYYGTLGDRRVGSLLVSKSTYNPDVASKKAAKEAKEAAEKFVEEYWKTH